MEKGPFGDSKIEQAVRLLQLSSRNAFVQEIRNFGALYRDAFITYWNGRYTGQGLFNPIISRLLAFGMPLIQSALTYKKGLSYIHAFSPDLIVPDVAVFDRIQAFFTCVRHCTNPEKWPLFPKVSNLIDQLKTLFLDDHLHPMSNTEFDRGLTDTIDVTANLLSGDLRDAVRERETGIREGRAKEIPDPDKEDEKPQEVNSNGLIVDVNGKPAVRAVVVRKPQAHPRERTSVEQKVTEDNRAVVKEINRRYQDANNKLSIPEIIAAMRASSAYAGRMRGKNDATWKRYAAEARRRAKKDAK